MHTYAQRDHSSTAHSAPSSRIALERIGRLEDVMEAVVYPCSDAAALVTGSALMVHGGWTAA